MIKGIIFDLDGVIVSTDDMHYQAWKSIANKLDIPFNPEINHRLRGVSRMESLEIILSNSTKAFNKLEKTALANEKNAYYVELLELLTERDILPSVLITLTWLKHRKYKLSIGSSSKNAKTILKRIGLLEWFDVIIDGNDISNSKPHPEVFLTAAQRMNLKPYECVVVEDARAGIDAAIAAEMITFGLGQASKYSKTNYPIEEIKDMIDILNRKSSP